MFLDFSQHEIKNFIADLFPIFVPYRDHCLLKFLTLFRGQLDHFNPVLLAVFRDADTTLGEFVVQFSIDPPIGVNGHLGGFPENLLILR